MVPERRSEMQEGMVSKEIGKHIGKQILPINDSNNV